MYDVIFIGSGHASWHAAVTMAQAGRRIAVVECDLPGGTCPNYGCDAKILLDGPFEHREGLARYRGLCVDEPGRIDWAKLIAYKKDVIKGFPLDLEAAADALGIDFFKARGRVLGAHAVQAGEQVLEGDSIVIGTGQREAGLDVPGSEFLRSSRDFLDLEDIPQRVVFLGAGVISMEFASMAAMLGSDVAIVARGDRALREYPARYVSKLVEKMEGDGVSFRWNESVARVEGSDKGYAVVTEAGTVIECDYIVNATGRVANCAELGLEELGIRTSRHGIEVDGFMRTSVPSVYACGDVVAKPIPKLTPTAEFESNYVAALLLGQTDEPISYPPVPNLVFTLPRIAQVGVSMEEAEEQPEHYRVVAIPYGEQNEWIANRELGIDFTFVIDREGHLAGAAIYGDEAATWIDFLALIVNQRLSADDLRRMIFAFPTHTYMLVTLLVPLLAEF